MELKDTLKAKQKEAKKKYDQLEKERITAINQRAELDRHLAFIAKEQTLLQGEHRVLEDLLNNKKKEGLKDGKRGKDTD